MNTVWEYVIHATRKGETWHLIDSREPALTLCGRPVEKDWVSGDETVSGIRTTCGNCRRGMNR